MNDRLFERALHQWLEEGSDRTPPAAVDAVLLAIKTTPQQRDLRILRRFTRMPNYLRYAAAVAIVATVGVGALFYFGSGRGVGADPSESPTLPTGTSIPSVAPTATPSPSPEPVAFTSPLYRYTVTVPGDWVATAATIPWQGRTTPIDLSLDKFRGPPASPDFEDVYVASQPLDGMTPDEWMLGYAEAMASSPRDCKGPVDAWAEADVDSLATRRIDLECQGIRLSDVVFVVENRGHLMTGNRDVIALFLSTFEHGEFFGQTP